MFNTLYQTDRSHRHRAHWSDVTRSGNIGQGLGEILLLFINCLIILNCVIVILTHILCELFR